MYCTFAIGRAHRALEAHAFHGLLEGLVLAALQVVAAGENNPVVFGQLHAGQADGVDALHLPGQAVEHQVAPLLFAVRQDLEQDQAAQAGEFDLPVVQGLGLVHHLFAVDAQAVLGVVLDLDGQVAAEGFDEHRVEDVHVREATFHRHLAGGLLPFEIKRRRQGDVALAAVVDVAHVAPIQGDGPAEHSNIGDALANLKTRQQLAVTDGQLQQASVLVIGVQLVEIVEEALGIEECAFQGTDSAS